MGVNLPLDPTGEPSAAERSIPARAPLSGDTLNAIEERILAPLNEAQRRAVT